MKYFSKVFSIMLIVGMLFGFIQPGISQAQAPNANPVINTTNKIEASLLDQFSTEGKADFIVKFIEQADLSPAYQMDWEARGWFVYNTLAATVAKSQSNAKLLLDSAGLQYKSFIAGNELYVWGSDLTVAQNLSALSEVDSIRATRTYHIDPVEDKSSSVLNSTWAGDLLANNASFDLSLDATTDWGILDTKANQFWTQYGIQGEGIVVSSIDTGVQWNHPALDQSFKCGSDPSDPACWADPSNICGGSACDNNGHGTHSMGTMVADDDPSLAYIAGMAPNAQWIACKGCETSSCSDFALNSCADWIVAPNGDPDNRPNIVNNSWGGGGGEDWYLPKVEAWRAAGIFPAFSAGNNYTCSSLGSPGDYQESFATAAHDVNRLIADFSSKGPSTFGHDPYTKPNISSPGVNICSSVPGGGFECAGWSGTSMASPHTAGAVALLWSCNPSLVGQIDQTFQILQENTNTPPEGSCGAPPDGEGNYTFGYGYLDVLAAGLLNCGDIGYLDGHVTSQSEPIEGVTVTATPALNSESMIEAITDPNGYYHMPLVVGVYDVSAEHPLYTTVVVPDVEITVDVTTTQDIVMDPKGHLFGYVADEPNGFQLVGATVSADDGTTTATDDTGFYEMYLDPGSYSVTASMPDYASQSLPADISSGVDTQLDFGLLAAISVVPDPIQTNVMFGQTGSVDATAINNLDQDYPFEFLEIEGGLPSGEQLLAVGGPDPFGYTFVDSNEPGGTLYEWLDATDGTPLELSDDGEANVTLPFAFDFYGTSSTDIRVGNNGGVLFGVTTGDLSTANADLSNSSTNNLIAPFWDDIDSDTGDVYYKTIGSAPYRQFIVEWFDRPHFSNIGNGTFELIFYETTNNIKYQYQDVVYGNPSYDFGVSATVGIRQETPNYLQYSYNQPVIQDNLAICFQYPGSSPCDGADVLWLGESIPGGAVPANGETLTWTNYFTATEAAGIMQPGEFFATLRMQPSEPDFPVKLVHVILTVEPTLTQGLLEGTVTSDRPGGPLTADILIESSGGMTWTLTTDENGFYSYYLEEGEYTVTASSADYLSQSAAVTIAGNNSTIQDFELMLDAPGIVVTPPSLEVTLEMGQQTTENLSVENIGPEDLNFEFSEIPGGFSIGNGANLPEALWPGPDGFGYHGEITNYAWVDIASTGTSVLLSDDGYSSAIPLGFSFPLYEVTFADFYIASNGYLSFGSGSSTLTNQCPLPNATTPNNIIPILWDDLDPGDTGDLVYYQGFSYCPVGSGACMVVQYQNYHHYPGGGTIAGTFEAILFDNGSVLMQYLDAGAEEGSGSTTGLEGNDTPSDFGLTFACDTPASLYDGLAMCYTYPGSSGCVAGDVPWVSEDPISGTIPAFGSFPIDVNFNSAVVTQPGVYTATLKVTNNDPLSPAIPVPLTMNVLPTQTLGVLEGTVTSDRPGGSLVADILIASNEGMTWTVPTDANGFYYLWLEEGDYSVTANSSDYLPQSADLTIVASETTTQDFMLLLDAPWINVDPASMEQTLQMGETALQAMSISNLGQEPLNFEIVERNGSYTPTKAGEDVLVVRHDATAADAMQYVLDALGYTYLGVTDAEFQAMTVDQLREFQAVFHAGTTGLSGNPSDSEILLMAYLDAGGSLFISDNDLGYYRHDSDFYATYLQSTYDVDNAGDYVDGLALMDGLTLNLTADPYPDGITVGTEGTAIFQFQGSVEQNGAAIDRNGYRAVYTGFDFQNLTDPDMAVEVISRVLNFIAVSDVPWLLEVPITGTVSVGETASISVTFDAGIASDPGTYTAELRVKHDDPLQQSVSLPITLTVEPSPEYGRLEGVITGMGYCDSNPLTMAAEVLIQAQDGSSWTVYTNPLDGSYFRWLLSGTYTVTASTENYMDATGIVEVIAQQTTQLNLDLRYLAPCMEMTPLEFSMTMPVDEQLAQTLTLSNSGAGELIWEVHETTRTIGTETISIPRFNGTLPEDKAPVSVEKAPTSQTHSPDLSVPLLVQASPGYVMNLVDDSLYYLPDLDVPGSWNLVSTPGVTSAYAGDFAYDTDTLYLVSDDTHLLYSVDVATGVATAVGPCVPVGAQTWTGMAWDPTTQTMYASGTDGVTATLYTINLETGAATQVVNISSAPYTIDIAVDSSGQMYAVDISLDSLLTIDKATGATSIIGSIGFTANYAQGLDFDLDNNILYMAAYNYNGVSGQGEMRIVDTSTGNTSLLGTFPGGNEVDALAVEAGGVPPWNDVPWVTEVPTHGVVGPDSAFDIDVVFDTTGLTPGECYTANLGLMHNDEGWDSPHYMPMSLCIMEPEYGVDLEPEALSSSGEPGEVVQYTLHLTNTGNVADTIQLTFSDVDPEWLVELPVSSFNLMAGQGTDVTVLVTIPINANNGEFDTFTLTAMSSHDPSAADDVEITTTAVVNVQHIFLPLAIKN